MEKKDLTVEELGIILGLSRSKAYELVHAKDGPPVVRIGKCIRIPADGLAEWLEQQSQRGARV